MPTKLWTSGPSRDDAPLRVEASRLPVERYRERFVRTDLPLEWDASRRLIIGCD